MSECNCDCKILKRVCAFFLGIVIGSAAGYQYGITTKTQHHHNRFIEESKKPTLLEKRERRKKLQEHLERTETPRIRVPR